MMLDDGWYTREVKFCGKWYDLDDPDSVKELEEAKRRKAERDEDEADWRYHSRRDDGL